MNKKDNTPVDPSKPRKHWPFKTVLEVFPIFMALSAMLTFGTTRKVSDVELLTPLSRVVSALPWWATLLMGGTMLVGIVGIVWVTFIFSRAPVAPDGSDEE
ncbi:MAG: hypothetical protein U0175_38965 [Caldilineaceae bacterium]